MKDAYSFIYLDKKQIRMLYPQIFGDTIKKKITRSTEDSTDMSAGATFFSLLISRIGSKKNNSMVENKKTVMTVARQAQLLINEFKCDKILIIEDIIRENCPMNESLHFVGQATFWIDEIFNKKTGASLLENKKKQLPKDYTSGTDSALFVLDDESLFVLKSGYDISSQVNPKEGENEIIMHMSNTYVQKDIRHLTSIIRKNALFKFFVFGELIEIKKNIVIGLVLLQYGNNRKFMPNFNHD